MGVLLAVLACGVVQAFEVLDFHDEASGSCQGVAFCALAVLEVAFLEVDPASSCHEGRVDLDAACSFLGGVLFVDFVAVEGVAVFWIELRTVEKENSDEKILLQTSARQFYKELQGSKRHE